MESQVNADVCWGEEREGGSEATSGRLLVMRVGAYGAFNGAETPDVLRSLLWLTYNSVQEPYSIVYNQTFQTATEHYIVHRHIRKERHITTYW